MAGRFLSPDPLGHNSDPSLYAAFNGDAINYFDPDGRFGKNAWVGATQGDFASGNTGWGGVAGQTAAGLIPIYGQIGDARDTAAALRNMGNGGWSDGGNWVNLAAVGVAWIPGLDWVKGMDNVARQLDNVPLPHGHTPDLPSGGGLPPNMGSDLPYDPRDIRAQLEAKYGAENVSSTTVPPSNASNVKYAGEAHPETGIVFDQRGFPVFDDVAAFDTKLPAQSFTAATYEQQMRMASQDLWAAIQRGEVSAGKFNQQQLGQIQAGAVKIDGLTWHHHQDRGRMQLVPFDFHSETRHIGGAAMSTGR